MEPRFQVEAVHDREAHRNMVTVHYMLHQKNSVKALYAVGALLALCVWWTTANGDLTSIRALGTGLLTFAVLFLAIPYIDRFAARQGCARVLGRVVKGAKKSKTFGIPTRYRFYEDRLDASDSEGTIETPYSQVTDLVETQGYHLIFLQSGQCIVARKSDLTLGTPEELGPFLAEACGRPLRTYEMPA